MCIVWGVPLKGSASPISPQYDPDGVFVNGGG